MSVNPVLVGPTNHDRTMIRAVQILAGVGAAAVIVLSFSGNEFAAGLAALVFPPAVVVMTWRLAAGIWQRQGHGVTARHLGGAAVGLFAGFLVMAVIIAPYVETPPPTQPEQAPPQTAPTVESRPHAEQPAPPAIEQPPPATAAQAPAMPPQQTQAVEQAPIEPKAQQSETPPAKEISEPAEPAKPTLGLTPEQFRTRLNDVVRQIDESWKQAEFDIETGEDSDTFKRTLSDNLAMVGMVSKRNGRLESLTLLLSGAEADEKVKLVAFLLSATYAANPGITRQKSAKAVSAMFDRAVKGLEGGFSEKRRVGNAIYSVTASTDIGFMVSVYPYGENSE